MFPRYFMNSEELSLMIKEGEGLTVEFKGKYTSKIDRDFVAMAFLKKHLNVRSAIRELDRYNIYEIPLDTLREALVNALVHRDYSIRDTNISMSIYDDRVEVSNPGEASIWSFKGEFWKGVRQAPFDNCGFVPPNGQDEACWFWNR